MELMTKIALLAIVSLVLLTIVRQNSGAIAPALTLCITAAIIVLLLPQMSVLITFCKNLAELSGIDGELFLPVVKVIGICITAKILGEMCRDAGEGALGAKVDMAGSVIGLVCVLPLLERALKMISAI